MNLREIEMTCLGLESISLDSKASHRSNTLLASQILYPDRPDSLAFFLGEGAPELGSDSAPPPIPGTSCLLAPVIEDTSLRGHFLLPHPVEARGVQLLLLKGREIQRKVSDSNFGIHLGRRCSWCLRVFCSSVHLFIYSADMYKEPALCQAQLQVPGSPW